MHRHLIRLLPVLLLFGTALPGLEGQQKFEKEYRIALEEVPSPALEFVDQLPVTRKVRWYREIGLSATTIEAKTKIRRELYSIEFSENGQLEDIEIERPWESVPPVVRSRITAHLDTTYDRHKVLRTQVQYTGPPVQLIRCVRQPVSCSEVTRRFELVLKTRKGKTFQMMEYLISETGAVILASEIVLRNTDNLEY